MVRKVSRGNTPGGTAQKSQKSKSQQLVLHLCGKWMQHETPVAGAHTSLHGLLTVADHQQMNLS